MNPKLPGWTPRIASAVAGLTVGAGALLLAPPLFPDTHIVSAIAIARPPAEVFDYATTPADWPRWHPSSLSVHGRTDHSLALGESVTEDVLAGGHHGTVTWTVVVRDAPYRWVIEGADGSSGSATRITYTLRPSGEGTWFERKLVYHMPNLLGAILDGFGLRDRIAAESATAVARLKAELEHSRTPAAADSGK